MSTSHRTAKVKLEGIEMLSCYPEGLHPMAGSHDDPIVISSF